MLVDLGAEMRRGLSGISAEDMRELTKRRFQLVAALVKRAGEIAAAAGRGVGADAVGCRSRRRSRRRCPIRRAPMRSLAGRLSEPLTVSGFGFGNPFAVVDAGRAVETSSTSERIGRRRPRRSSGPRPTWWLRRRLRGWRTNASTTPERGSTSPLSSTTRRWLRSSSSTRQLEQAEAELERRATAIEKLTASRENAEDEAVEADQEVHAARQRLDDLKR